MAAETPEKLTIREGLIQVVSAERFRSKPMGGTNAHVVVMQKTGGALRHYCTLRSNQDRLSIGEQLWGDFVCYVVDLAQRKMQIEQDYVTFDRITNVHVVTHLTYHAVDGERVALGVDDALRSLREKLVTLLRREIVRLPMEKVTEEDLEARVEQEMQRVESRMGLALDGVRIQVDWPEEELSRRRASAEAERQRKADDAKRQREWQIDDQARVRKQNIDLEDIDHIDRVIRRLGLDGLPPDLRLYLHRLPREEALQRIIEVAAEQRKLAQNVAVRRMEEEYAILSKLIDEKVLDGPDLEDLGRDLVDRYRHSLAFEQILGTPSSFLFGEAERPKGSLPSGASPEDKASGGQPEEKKEQTPGTDTAPGESG